jgi:hypothetical protein
MFSIMDTGTAIALTIYVTGTIALFVGAALWIKRTLSR